MKQNFNASLTESKKLIVFSIQRKALKAIKKSSISKSEYEQLKEEVYILEGCRHHNLTEIFLHFKLDGVFYILSELCEVRNFIFIEKI